MVIAIQSITLDGFSAGAGDVPANPIGDGGQRLHGWLAASRGFPAYVLAHQPREPMPKHGDIQFTFVADGIDGALGRARVTAGDKDVAVAGGASTIQQFIAAGFLVELNVHLIPIVLGSGIRLFDQLGRVRFEIEPAGAIVSTGITHRRYCLVR